MVLCCVNDTARARGAHGSLPRAPHGRQDSVRLRAQQDRATLLGSPEEGEHVPNDPHGTGLESPAGRSAAHRPVGAMHSAAAAAPLRSGPRCAPSEDDGVQASGGSLTATRASVE